jgi:hypothetical protein
LTTAKELGHDIEDEKQYEEDEDDEEQEEGN